ncbi:collagen binding domain-containing protein [Streptomyces sp. NPDC059928]|uniref:MSCRAMM family protein n=1 Tax=unclassified Streptomyces TaxID=2593676 RepID=UPI0036461BBC
MRIRSARRLPAAVAVAATVTGTVAWAPAASAHAPETMAGAPVLVPRNLTETGGIKILKKDPGGDTMAGATFALLDSAGKEIATGKTDTDGQLVFKDLTAGVYRLKETSSGSPLHNTVADQDVIVTPGTGTPLTVVDPFKPADLTVTKTDKTSGKPLAGAVINITPTGNGGDPVTLTTGKDGTAKAQLPVASRNGTTYTATETRAPEGYQLDSTPQKVTAKPGAPVAITLTDTKKEQPPSPKPTPPTPDTSTPPKPTPHTSTAPSPSASVSASASPVPVPDETTPSPQAPAPEGSLAHTGADATPWMLGGAGLLLAAGAGAVFIARRRRTDDSSSDDGSAGS